MQSTKIEITKQLIFFLLKRSRKPKQSVFTFALTMGDVYPDLQPVKWNEHEQNSAVVQILCQKLFFFVPKRNILYQKCSKIEISQFQQQFGNQK